MRIERTEQDPSALPRHIGWFTAGCVIVGSALYERPVEGGLGIATVLAGTPPYLLWRRQSGVRSR